MDFQQWTSTVKQWNGCRVGGVREGHQKPDDCITVFLNFKKLGEFKDYKSAQALIRKLIDDAPVSLEEFKEYLLQ